MLPNAHKLIQKEMKFKPKQTLDEWKTPWAVFPKQYNFGLIEVSDRCGCP